MFLQNIVIWSNFFFHSNNKSQIFLYCSAEDKNNSSSKEIDNNDENKDCDESDEYYYDLCISTDGYFNVTNSLTYESYNLTTPTTFICEVTIPGTDYKEVKNLLYYPGN